MKHFVSSAFCAPAEALLNGLLAQDPGTARRLARHHGQAVRVECTSPLQWQIFILVQEERLSIRSVYEPAPQAEIAASASAFSRLLIGGGQTDALFSPDIRLGGDTHLIQDLNQILRDLEVDWEHHFSALFGDVATHQLSQFFGKALEWTAQTRTTLLADVEEYLHEEARLLPGASEVNHFSNRVDELKLAVDRMNARQQRLLQKLQTLSTR
jgi:ubiquinone biosynthesis protein UbiJ